MSKTDVWEFFLEEEVAVKRMCRLLARSDGWLFDDLYTEAAIRIPRIWEMHSPNRLRSLRILRWYLWKYRNAYNKGKMLTFEGDIANKEGTLKSDLEDEVSFLVEGMEPHEIKLLMWKSEGFTYREIGNCLGVCACTARNYYLAALEKVKDTHRGACKRL